MCKFFNTNFIKLIIKIILYLFPLLYDNKINYLLQKEKDDNVSTLNSDLIPLEIDKKDYLPVYAPHLIGLSCFSVILLIFCIFYIRKRNN